MSSENLGVIFWEYLHQHRRMLLLFGVFTLVFAMVFSLYDLELEAVWYAATLCAALAGVWTAVRFGAYVRRHRQLFRLRQDVRLRLDKLPPADHLMESDYQTLLRALDAQTAQLLNRAEGSRRELTDYYTTWVHQIKTPIAAMRLLLRESPPDSAGELTAELLQIEQYVEMVLAYLHLGDAGTDFVFRPCQIEPIARKAVARFAPQFIRKKLKLQFEAAAIKAVTDEKWLQFCLEQLLSNAIKYTVKGGVRIWAEGDVLVIADTGMGIAEEDLPRIFERGFTGYNGRTNRKSTGIGLYLCKQILDKLGHGLTIEAAVGKGTTVRVDLSRRETVYE